MATRASACPSQRSRCLVLVPRAPRSRLSANASATSAEIDRRGHQHRPERPSGPPRSSGPAEVRGAPGGERPAEPDVDADAVEGVEETRRSRRRAADSRGTPCTAPASGSNTSRRPQPEHEQRVRRTRSRPRPARGAAAGGSGRRARRGRSAAERRCRAGGRARTPPPSRCRGCSTRARTTRTRGGEQRRRRRHRAGAPTRRARPASSAQPAASSAATRDGDRSQPPPISFGGVELDRSRPTNAIRGLAPRDRDREDAEREPATSSTTTATASCGSWANRDEGSRPAQCLRSLGLRPPGGQVRPRLLRDLPHAGPVRVHRVHAVFAVAVRDEGDLATVRRPRVGAVVDLAAAAARQLAQTASVGVDDVDVRRAWRPELRRAEDDLRAVGRAVDLVRQ